VNPEEAAPAFIAAWNVEDDGERQRLLAACCATDARFVSPQGVTSGLEDFGRSVGAFRRAFPRAEVVLGRPDQHSGYARFRWETRWNDGRDPLTGEDLVAFGADGRIQLVVSFDGSPDPPSDQKPLL
jgi:hypothetical protein